MGELGNGIRNGKKGEPVTLKFSETAPFFYYKLFFNVSHISSPSEIFRKGWSFVLPNRFSNVSLSQ